MRKIEMPISAGRPHKVWMQTVIGGAALAQQCGQLFLHVAGNYFFWMETMDFPSCIPFETIDLESRKYSGRWYTDVKAWKVARSDFFSKKYDVSRTRELKCH